MTRTSNPAPAFVPTTTPLPPQSVDPGELAVILAEAAARHAEAEAALAAAQDHFDAANLQREYALSEEQKRRDLEEEARVGALRAEYPSHNDAVAEARRQFLAAFDEEEIDFERVFRLYVEWQRSGFLAARVKQQILAYDAGQSSDVYESWMRRISGWTELIRSVLSWEHGGVPSNTEDDLDGLAAVNLRINQESQSAPRPLNRDARDQSTPFIEDLGLRDPASASADQIFGHQFEGVFFDKAFSEGVAQAAATRAQRLVPGPKTY
jgi:hypothetical protein